MGRSDWQIQRDSEPRFMTVTEVNTAERYVAGTDNFGSALRISLHVHDPLIAVPVVGEVWLLQRKGHDWLLWKQAETGGADSGYEGLDPGDRQLSAPGTVHVSAGGNVEFAADEVLVNGVNVLASGGQEVNRHPAADVTIDPGFSLVVGSDFEIASGHVLEIGLDGVLVIV